MEKELGNIKFTKLDQGIRIEMTGEKFANLGECCLPMVGGKSFAACCCTGNAKDCCAPVEESKKDKTKK